jgi:hypothetical protein
MLIIMCSACDFFSEIKKIDSEKICQVVSLEVNYGEAENFCAQLYFLSLNPTLHALK